MTQSTPSEKIIPIYGREGKRAYAFVSAEDFSIVSQFRWCMNAYGYAIRKERVSESGNSQSCGHVFLHRQIMGLGKFAKNKMVVDHVNRNRLDCRRENLRLVPRKFNAFARIQLAEVNSKLSETIPLKPPGAYMELPAQKGPEK